MIATRGPINSRVPASAGGPRSEGFLGRSAVSLPFKGVVRRISSSTETMEVVDIDLDILKVTWFSSLAMARDISFQRYHQDAREVYKIREDAEARREQAMSRHL
jgi:hypothetical protein